MVKKVKEDCVQLGVCYYPEHWPESMWDDDMRRMKQLNFSYIRIGEFAWSIFEPQEGVFQFELFDKDTDILLAEGFNDILQVECDTVEVIATYKDKYYAGKPALTRNLVGKGEVYYYGVAFSQAVVE